jgi:hypothetical protein
VKAKTRKRAIRAVQGWMWEKVKMSLMNRAVLALGPLLQWIRLQAVRWWAWG